VYDVVALIGRAWRATPDPAFTGVPVVAGRYREYGKTLRAIVIRDPLVRPHGSRWTCWQWRR